MLRRLEPHPRPLARQHRLHLHPQRQGQRLLTLRPLHLQLMQQVRTSPPPPAATTLIHRPINPSIIPSASRSGPATLLPRLCRIETPSAPQPPSPRAHSASHPHHRRRIRSQRRHPRAATHRSPQTDSLPSPASPPPAKPCAYTPPHTRPPEAPSPPSPICDSSATPVPCRAHCT